MAFKETKLPANAPAGHKALAWVDDRFPLSKLWNDQWGKYYAPKNFNTWYLFGSLAMLVLVLQIVTGIFLTMHYKPDAALASARSNTSCAKCPGAGWCATCTPPAPRCSSSWSTCTWPVA